MATVTDPVSGFERDDFEPGRPLPHATPDDVAARQRADCERRLLAGEIRGREERMTRRRVGR